MTIAELFAATRRIRQLYEQLCRPVCREWGLNQTELDILLFLAQNPGCNTARDVACRCQIKKALVSVSVEKLVLQGYLARQRDSGDHRLCHLVPTEQAEVAIAQGRHRQTTFLDAVCCYLNPEEQAAYVDILKKITRATDELAGQGAPVSKEELL